MSTNTRRLDPSVMSEIRLGLDQAINASDQKIAAVVGNTGSGKSTFVNAQLGCEMVRVRNERGRCVVSVRDPRNEIAPIGDKLTEAETKYTSIYKRRGDSFAYADCGGLMDTRGLGGELTVRSSMKFTLEKAKSVKIVLCLHVEDGLTETRCQTLRVIFEDVMQRLSIDFEAYPNSILVLVTRAGTDDETIAEIGEALDEYPEDSRIRKCLNFILRDNKNYIHAYNPLDQGSVEFVNHRLNEMTGIEQESYGVACSPEAREALSNEFAAITLEGSRLYDQYVLGCDKIQDHTDHIEKLNQSIQGTKDKIAGLGAAGNRDPDAVIAEKESAINQVEVDIAQQKDIIREAEIRVYQQKKSVKAGQASCSAGEARIRLMAQPAYRSSRRSDSIEEPARLNDERIEKKFSFRLSAVIDRVLMEKDEAGKWKDQEGGQGFNYFKVTYVSGKGKAARANVDVCYTSPVDHECIKRFDYKLREQFRGIAYQSCELNDCTDVLTACTGVMNNLESTIERLKNEKNLVQVYADILLPLQEEKSEWEARLAIEINRIADLKNEIAANEHFKLLKDYIEISGDDDLRSQSVIAQFLEKDLNFRSCI